MRSKVFKEQGTRKTPTSAINNKESFEQLMAEDNPMWMWVSCVPVWH